VRISYPNAVWGFRVEAVSNVFPVVRQIIEIAIVVVPISMASPLSL
jgi:hypothetical protein